MITRDFNPQSKPDADALDLLIDGNRGHNVLLSDDLIMVDDVGLSINEPRFAGVIVARPVMYMHELIVAPDFNRTRRMVAERLVTHALSKGGMLGERWAHFTVKDDNQAMHLFMESKRALRQPDGALYQLKIPTAYYRGGMKTNETSR